MSEGKTPKTGLGELGELGDVKIRAIWPVLKWVGLALARWWAPLLLGTGIGVRVTPLISQPPTVQVSAPAMKGSERALCAGLLLVVNSLGLEKPTPQIKEPCK